MRSNRQAVKPARSPRRIRPVADETLALPNQLRAPGLGGGLGRGLGVAWDLGVGEGLDGW